MHIHTYTHTPTQTHSLSHLHLHAQHVHHTHKCRTRPSPAKFEKCLRKQSLKRRFAGAMLEGNTPSQNSLWCVSRGLCLPGCLGAWLRVLRRVLARLVPWQQRSVGCTRLSAYRHASCACVPPARCGGAQYRVWFLVLCVQGMQAVNIAEEARGMALRLKSSQEWRGGAKKRLFVSSVHKVHFVWRVHAPLTPG